MIATLQVKKDRAIIITDMGRRYEVEFDSFVYIRKGTKLIESDTELVNKDNEPVRKYQISFFFRRNVKATNASITLTDYELERLLSLTKMELENATDL